MIPGFNQGKLIRYIGKKILGIRCKGIRQHNLLSAPDSKEKQALGDIIIIQLQVFLIFKLRHHLSMVDNGTHNQLREKGDKQQIINKVILLCLSPVGVYQEGNQLKGKEGYTDRKGDMLQSKIHSRKGVKIFNKEICIFIVSQQGYIRHHSDEQQKLPLGFLFSIQMPQAGAHQIISRNAGQEKHEEIRASLSVEIQGGNCQPDFRDGIILEVVKEKIYKKSNGQK